MGTTTLGARRRRRARTRLIITAATGLTLAALLPAAADARLAYVCEKVEICIAADDGTAPVKITTGGTDPRTGNNTRPAVSASGDRVAYVSNGATWVHVVSMNARKAVAPGEVGGMAYRPDGEELATIEFAGIENTINLTCRYTFAGGPASRACSQAPEGVPAAQRIAYAPDGRLLASVNDGTGGWKICAYTPGAGCTADLATGTPGFVQDFEVSPDGKRVVVVVDQLAPGAPRTRSIGVFPVGGGARLAELSTTATDGSPTWTPDGASVVFTRAEFDPSSLQIVPATGTPAAAKLFLAGARDADFGGPFVAPKPLVGTSVSSKQKGTAVKGSVDVGVAGSTVKVTLPNGYGTLTRKATKTGKLPFTVKLNAKGRKALRAKRRLTLKVRVSVTPPTGKAVAQTRTVTLRA